MGEVPNCMVGGADAIQSTLRVREGFANPGAVGRGIQDRHFP